MFSSVLNRKDHSGNDTGKYDYSKHYDKSFHVIYYDEFFAIVQV